MKVQGVGNVSLHLQRETKAEVLPGGQETNSAGVTARPQEQAGQAGEKKKIDLAVLEEAVEQTNKTMETYRTELRFSIHEASGEMVVKVISLRDNSVIREIPPERLLDFVAHVKEMLGIIIDKFI